MTCGHCPRRFLSVDHARQHERNVHSGGSQYECEHCGGAYSGADKVLRHMARCPEKNKAKDVHEIKNERIEDAEEAGNTAKDVERATKDIEFASQGNLNRHKIGMHGKKEETPRDDTGVKCDDCGASFTTHVSLTRHQLRVHVDESEVESFGCDLCSKSFANRANLKRHKKEVHEKKESTPHDDAGVTCDDCGISFTRYSSLTRHRLQEHVDASEVPSFECDICSKSFTNRANVKRHKQDVHEKKEETPRDDAHVKCDDCGASFTTHGSLKRHRLRAHVDASEVPSFECDLCNKSFVNRSNLKRHRQDVHAEQEAERVQKKARIEDVDSEDDVPNELGFKCDACDKVYTSRKNLNRHQDVKGHAKKRKRSDDGEEDDAKKPRNEGRKSSTSSEERIFTCEQCPKTYSWIDGLRKHVRKAHGSREKNTEEDLEQEEEGLKKETQDNKSESGVSKKYRCKQCPKTYNWVKGLQRHVRKVHGSVEEEHVEGGGVDEIESESGASKKFRCKHCPKTYNWAAGRKRHVRDAHGTNIDEHVEGVIIEDRVEGGAEEIESESGADDKGAFQCEQCPKSYRWAQGLRRHVDKSHKGKEAAGPEDMESSSEVQTEDNADNDALSMKRYKCDLCPKRYQYKSSLKRHNEDSHKELTNSSDQEDLPAPEAKVECNLCPLSFDDLNSLFSHKHDAHMSKPDETSNRGKEAPESHEENALTLRDSSSESDQDESPLPVPVVRCAKCPERFASNQELEDHEKKAHGEGQDGSDCEETKETKDQEKHKKPTAKGLEKDRRISVNDDTPKTVPNEDPDETDDPLATTAQDDPLSTSDFKCGICEKSFPTMDERVSHVRRGHFKVGQVGSNKTLVEPKTEPENRSGGRVFHKCPHCRTSFISVEMRRRHIDSFHSEKEIAEEANAINPDPLGISAPEEVQEAPAPQAPIEVVDLEADPLDTTDFVAATST